MTDDANEKSESKARAQESARVSKAALVSRSDDPPKPAESQHYGQLANNWINPPYDLWHLTLLPEVSSELGPCIDAIVEGAFGHGMQLVSRTSLEEGLEMGSAEDALFKKERAQARSFLRRINRTQDIVALAKELARDYLATGNAYLESTRSVDGRVASLHSVPAHQVRICPVETNAIGVTPKIVERKPGDDGWFVSSSRTFFDRYRKYLRSPNVGNGWADLHIMHPYADKYLGVGGWTSNGFCADGWRWYKEFGDLRTYDDKSGELANEAKPVQPGEQAHELYHFVTPAKRGPYGLPSHIGNRLSILGDRKQEEINYHTLLNNSVPSMMLCVSDGEITQDSADRLREFWEANVRGSDNRSKIVIVEAKPFVSDTEEPLGKPKIHVEKMYDAQIRDQMYEKYSDRNRKAIRHGFRLPDIVLGEGSMTDTSRQVIREKLTFVDMHVWGPMRQLIEEFVNERLFPEQGWAHVMLKFNSPNTTDPEVLASVARDLEKSGGMTPARSSMLAETIAGRKLPPMDTTKVQMNVPFTLQVMEWQKKADDAARAAGSPSKEDEANLADPVEPSQQVMGEG